MHYKELRTGAVRMHGPGHGYYAPLMGDGVIYAVHGKFALDMVSGAAHAGALRAAALYHEAGNDPVEDKAVVKALIRKMLKVLYGIGCGC